MHNIYIKKMECKIKDAYKDALNILIYMYKKMHKDSQNGEKMHTNMHKKMTKNA